jgi:hypothetical protein
MPTFDERLDSLESELASLNNRLKSIEKDYVSHESTIFNTVLSLKSRQIELIQDVNNLKKLCEPSLIEALEAKHKYCMQGMDAVYLKIAAEKEQQQLLKKINQMPAIEFNDRLKNLEELMHKLGRLLDEHY